MSNAFTVTFFENAAAQKAITALVTLQQLAELIVTTNAPRKDLLPWLKCAVFGDQPTEKGCLRHDANVKFITGVEGDHDSGLVSLDEAYNLLSKAGVTALLYTSPSYTEAHPRWRVIAPCSGPLPPERREHLVGRLNGVLGGALAAESFTLSQSYFFGAVAGNPMHRCVIA